MKRLFVYAAFLLVCLLPLLTQAQPKPGYVWQKPTDPKVLERLEEWQDIKFGLLMHWGTYSQWGIVESWSLCPEDWGWCERRMGTNPQCFFTYKQEYENLKLTFNPVGFEPERWAEAAYRAGMKYVVFTTKHHDGFSMWDTDYTDYRITSPLVPFHRNPRADVTRAIFDEFRAKGIWAGVYFSKADWNSPYYWHPYWPPFDRNVNYDPAVYPEKWENFVQFTHNQIMELMTEYGDIRILWLDGGWVQKMTPEQIKAAYLRQIEQYPSGFIKSRIVNQDIRMDELVKRAREKQPGLIVVDRAVEGPNQNYLTPENYVPGLHLGVPWESCIISGGSWSWIPDPNYLTPRQVVQTLVDIVAKGGNLLLNIAPGPDGRWDPAAYTMLEGVGKWMDVNSEAIYKTRPFAPFVVDNVRFTRRRDTQMVYAIVLPEENQETIPSVVEIKGVSPHQNARINLLGAPGNLRWQRTADGINIFIPARLQSTPPNKEAWAFRISRVNE
jgi:alpha-L-fucosidase